ncbi:MAG: hypothetical protein L6R42_004632 [Xanthoria sp. 1 TBL-2021]|nr:MAG: hypothetical protein L6R42_004632 [Xanthoria sp. 1 TBL-2021]
MRSIHLYLLSAISLSSAVLAAPTKTGKGSFKIQRRRISARSLGGGAAELGKAYRKYGWDVPTALSDKSSTHKSLALGDPKDPDDDTGNIPADEEEGDVSFLAPITVGGQPLMMNFDTGSSDLWVFSTSLPAEQQALGHSIFDPAKSRTFQPLQGASWKITYGDNSFARGTVGTDTVDIGGAKVEGQAIELATTVADSFLEDTKADGLVGLGFGSLNTVKPQKQKTFFENVMPSLDKPVFTANLRHHELGSYEFGKIDESQFEGPITYTPVDASSGFWQIESKSFAIGNGETQTNPNATPAIIDSGTTLILADDGVVKAYWGQVEGAEVNEDGVTFPCNTQLPDFHIALGPTYMASVPGDLMNYMRVSNGARGVCFGGLQSNSGGSKQIYGDVLFKSQFVVFDGANKTVGFAPHK